VEATTAAEETVVTGPLSVFKFRIASFRRAETDKSVPLVLVGERGNFSLSATSGASAARKRAAMSEFSDPKPSAAPAARRSGSDEPNIDVPVSSDAGAPVPGDNGSKIGVGNPSGNGDSGRDGDSAK
jgi:hypothetical protein